MDTGICSIHTNPFFLTLSVFLQAVMRFPGNVAVTSPTGLPFMTSPALSHSLLTPSLQLLQSSFFPDYPSFAPWSATFSPTVNNSESSILIFLFGLYSCSACLHCVLIINL